MTMGLRVGIYSTPWIGTYAAHIGSYSDNPDGVNEWIKKGRHNEHYRYQKEGGNYWEGPDRSLAPRPLLLRGSRREAMGRMGH